MRYYVILMEDLPKSALHKMTSTISKKKSWNSKTINMISFIIFMEVAASALGSTYYLHPFLT
jgi:hypothetical protein